MRTDRDIGTLARRRIAWGTRARDPPAGSRDSVARRAGRRKGKA